MTELPTGVLVCFEKHGDFYWDASDMDALARSSLAILTERWNQGYWYFEPDEDGLGDSEWADNERAQRAKALAMTKEQLDALPEQARKAVVAMRKEAKRDTEEERRHREWYERAKAVVECQDLGTETVGRNRYAHAEPKAWVLLVERSDAEYERVSIEPLHTGAPVEVGT